MNATLLDQFLAEECNPYIQGLLQKALHAPEPPIKRFEFNRFEVDVDHKGALVVLQDVLDATPAGVSRVPLTEFAEALARWQG